MSVNWQNFELHKFESFCKHNNIWYEIDDEYITYKTSLGTWKIMYLENNKYFILYHFNQYKTLSRGGKNYSRSKDYHTQKIYPGDGFTLMRPLKNSYNHDKYKYQPKMTRMDYLFSQIENKNK